MRVILCLLCLLPSAVAAQELFSKTDSSLPIEIAADSLEVLQDKQQAIFSGAVEAVQGNMTMLADKMTVHYRGNENMASGENRIKRIVVEGNVKLDTGKEGAEGKRGIYDVDAQQVRLNGNVKLTQGQHQIEGESLVYYLQTGRSMISSGAAPATQGELKPSRGRVRGVFVPEQRP